MNNTLLIAHYVMWGALLVTAGITLRAYRGVSLLSIWSIGLAVQVGTGYAVAWDAGLVKLSAEAMERFGLSLILTYAILMVFLGGLYLLRDRSQDPQKVPPVTIPPFWMLIGVMLVATLAVVSVFSASGQWTLQHGWETLREGYYDARVELIDIHAANVSRVAIYGGATARQILVIMLIVAALELVRKWSLTKAAFYLTLISGLLIEGLVSFEKSPVFLVLAAGTVPFLLPTSSSRRRGVIRIAARLAITVVLLLLAGAILYSATERYSLADSLGKVLARIFVMPGYGSAMYFEAYPDLIPHTQWSDLRPVRLLLGNGSITPTEGSISTDVAKALTGSSFNANAAFVGVSWAAAGYFGVVVGTLIVALFCFLTDRFTMKARHAISLLPLGIFYWLGFVGYGNGSFLICLIHEGLWLVPGFYCLVLARRRTARTSAREKAPPPLSTVAPLAK